MVSIEKIRNTFEKGGVVLHNNDILVYYRPNGWVNENIDNEKQDILVSLIENSVEFFITIEPNSGLFIGFHFQNAVNPPDSSEFFKPLSSTPPSRVFQSASLSDELIEYLNSRDIKTAEDGVFAFLDYIQGDQSNVLSFSANKRWANILDLSKEFEKYITGYEKTVTPPDGSYPCIATLSYSFMANKRRVLRFAGKGKDIVVEFFRLSDGVEFEFGIHGVLNLYFGVEED